MMGGSYKPRRRVVAEDTGLTIVETLITLAVSMAILLSAIILMSGRQNKAAFTDAVQDLQSNLQEIMTQVGSGYFPDSTGFICESSGGGNPRVRIRTTSSNQQGTNDQCVFLGKAIAFDRNSPDTFRVYTVAGLKPNTDSFQYETIAEAGPNYVGPLTETKRLLHGLSIYCMKYNVATCNNPNGANTTGAISFLSSFASASSTGVLQGSQRTDSYPMTGTTIVSGYNAIQSALGDENAYGTAARNQPVLMCFRSATTNQSALITIGGSGKTGVVQVSVRSNQNCV